jgi:hypothetical protein
MNKSIFLILFVLFSSLSDAQDIITKTNGEEIKAKNT